MKKENFKIGNKVITDGLDPGYTGSKILVQTRLKILVHPWTPLYMDGELVAIFFIINFFYFVIKFYYRDINNKSDNKIGKVNDKKKYDLKF